MTPEILASTTLIFIWENRTRVLTWLAEGSNNKLVITEVMDKWHLLPGGCSVLASIHCALHIIGVFTHLFSLRLDLFNENLEVSFIKYVQIGKNYIFITETEKYKLLERKKNPIICFAFQR